MNKKYERLLKATSKAWMTRNEARSDIGLDPIDEWEEEDLLPPQIPPQFGNTLGRNGNQPEEEQEEELRTMQRWALSRVGKKNFTPAEFETVHTSPALAGAIIGALEGAKSADDVKQIFNDPFMGYP